MFCEQDKCILPEVQQGCIDRIERESEQKVAVYKYPLDHIPYFSKVESVVDAVQRAVNEQN
jgi:hypothetical protein